MSTHDQVLGRVAEAHPAVQSLAAVHLQEPVSGYASLGDDGAQGDPFMLRWLGMVRGVRVASGFSLTIWKCGCLHVQDGSPDSTEP
jgi:hypothetical protein